jgi:hypothetical protein
VEAIGLWKWLRLNGSIERIQPVLSRDEILMVYAGRIVLACIGSKLNPHE